MIDRGKRSKALTEVKPVKNISKNLQSFSRHKSCAKRSPSFTETARLCIWVLESFRIKVRQTLTDKLLESIESSRFVSHRARMSGEFESRKDLQSTKFEWRSRILKWAFSMHVFYKNIYKGKIRIKMENFFLKTVFFNKPIFCQNIAYFWF